MKEWTREELQAELMKLEEYKTDQGKFDRILKICSEIFASRNSKRRYAGAWKEGGLAGVMVVLRNKINRAIQSNPEKTEIKIIVENIDDTLIDIINYCIMGLISYQEDILQKKKDVEIDEPETTI